MKMAMIKRIFLCIAVLIYFNLDSDASGTDWSFEVPDGTDLCGLIDRPEEISSDVRVFFDPEAREQRLTGYTDYHGVYESDYDLIVKLLDSPEKIKMYSSRVIEVRAEKNEDGATTAYFDLGIVFLGHKVSYVSRMKSVKKVISKHETGFQTRLVESLDGNLYESYSAWYIKKVLINGRPMVYLRYYNRQGIRKPFLGMKSVVKVFTVREIKSMFAKLASHGRSM